MNTRKFEIKSDFNARACETCDVNDNCGGGWFVELFEDNGFNVGDILSNYTEDTTNAVKSRDTETLQGLISQLSQDLKNAQAKYAENITQIEIYLRRLIMLQSEDFSRVFPVSEAYDELIKWFREHGFDKYDTSLTHSELSVIANEILDFCFKGVCAAIDIEEK